MTVTTSTTTTTTTTSTTKSAVINRKLITKNEQKEEDVLQIVIEYLHHNYKIFNRDPPPPPLLGGKYDSRGSLEYPNVVDDVKRTEKDLVKNLFSFMTHQENYPVLSSTSSPLLLESENVLKQNKQLCQLIDQKSRWSWIQLGMVSKKWLNLVSSMYMFMGILWFNNSYIEHLFNPYCIFKRAPKIIVNRCDPDSYNRKNFNADNKVLVDFVQSANNLTLYGNKYFDIDKLFYEGVVFPEVEELIIHVTPNIDEIFKQLLPRLPKLKVLCCSDFDICSGEFTNFDSDEQFLRPLIDLVGQSKSLESLGLYIDGLSSEHFFVPFLQAFKTDQRLFDSKIERLVVDINPNIQTDFPWMLLLNIPYLKSFSLYDLHMVDYSVEFYEFLEVNRTIIDFDFIFICDEETADILGESYFMQKLDLFIAEYQDNVEEIYLPTDLKTLIIRLGNGSLISLTNSMIKGINESAKNLESLSFLIDGPLDPDVLAHEIQYNSTIKYLSFTCLRSKNKLIKKQQKQQQQQQIENNGDNEQPQKEDELPVDLYDPKISFASLFQVIKHYNTTLEVMNICFCPDILPEMIDCIIDHPSLKIINFEHFDNTLDPQRIRDLVSPHFIPNIDHLLSSSSTTSFTSKLLIIPTPRGVQIIKKDYLDKIIYQLSP